jgi:predicted nucleic acid-binding protein
MQSPRWVKIKYVDASALVKLYIDENGSQNLREFFYSNMANFLTTWLCLAEALNILKSKWVGKQSKDSATKIERDKYLKSTIDLVVDWRGRIDSDDLKEYDPSLPLKVREIADKYGLDYSDALQLITIKTGEFSVLSFESAPGVYEPASVLITADVGLASAAESEGIRVWNCTTGPTTEWLY